MTAPEIKTNLLSRLTVALALVPEAIAFAFVAHVNPLVGLYAAFIMCLITAKQIDVATRTDENGWKIYALRGSVFFASVAQFRTLFTPAEDPDEVVIEFRHARVMDHSALEAIDALAGRYSQLGKRLHLRGLSPDCREVLEKARDSVEVNLLEDPRYYVADNRIS